MKYFLYRMQSNDRPPGGGDFRSWLHFYKWGRPETVTFVKRAPYFDMQRGDVVFFVLDGFLIGDAAVARVQDFVFLGNESEPVQEFDVAPGGIWEYYRDWGWLDRLRDYWRLRGLGNEVSPAVAHRWLTSYRVTGHRHPFLALFLGYGFSEGGEAVYKEGDLPLFFGVPRKK